MKVYPQNPLHSQKSFIRPRIAPIEQMRFRKLEDGSIRLISDTALLANSERIRQELGDNTYLAMLSGMSPRPKSNYTDGNYTDEQLFHNIKQRYIQAPSEMKAWIDGLMAEGDAIIADAQARKKAAEEAAIAAAAAAAQQGQSSNPSE